MTALIVIGCIVLVILLLLLARVGCRVDYSQDGLVLDLKIAFFHIRLMPRQKKSAGGKKQKRRSRQKRRPRRKRKQKSAQKSKEKTGRRPGDLSWLLELVRPILTALGRLRRKLRVNYLHIDYIIGGMDDPARAAIRRGQVAAGGGALLPLIREAFNIRDFDLNLDVDFLAEKTRVAIQAEAVWRVGPLLRIAFSLGLGIVRSLIKRRNHSANKEDGQHGRKTSAQ